MSKPIRPRLIEKIGGELAIVWEDGLESYLPLEMVRRACPCAVCGGEPDALGRVLRPELTYQPSSFDLVEAEYVGGYAWQPTWGDGHRTGLFSWNYLRKLSETSSA